MKALLHELSPIDSSELELMDPLAVDSTRIFDTVVAAYLLDSDRSEFDEVYLADTYLQMTLPAAWWSRSRKKRRRWKNCTTRS